MSTEHAGITKPHPIRNKTVANSNETMCEITIYSPPNVGKNGVGILFDIPLTKLLEKMAGVGILSDTPLTKLLEILASYFTH